MENFSIPAIPKHPNTTHTNESYTNSLITKAMEVPNKMAKIVGEGKLNKSTKLKDLLGEK